ncbi:MAG: lyase family protein [Planctomycetota bacterium]|nr:lyase family protein [Planctomycetota bacterium]
MSKYDTYTSPLAERNASPEMLRLWSPRHKFQTWRRIWLAVAEAQHELGLPVTKEQVEELRANLDVTDADIELANTYERELRHDVMAHVHAWGDRCPKAKGIIHLGMTSQDVVCNADVLVLRHAMRLIETKVARTQTAFAEQSKRWSKTPTLGFTHYQPAQPTTVGRRIAQWTYDLDVAWLGGWPHYKGLKGATGTQASFLALCGNDHAKVDELEVRFLFRLFNELDDPGMFDSDRSALDQALSQLRHGAALNELPFPVSALDTYTHKLSGQTYPRVADANVLAGLASTAAVLHKIATDIRLLCNRKEIDEPFETRQIGSSAMPYKRNPMRCERICGLTRFVMNLVGNAYDTAATQWLERTLDDSSNRRLSLPEAFLALDGALDLMHNVASGLIVHEAMVRKNLMAELPFMATENILMECVKLGGDRQHYHELIRVHAQAAGLRVKSEGLDNDLLERLKADKNFWSTARGGPLSAELNWDGVMDPMKYVGRSVEQTERFIKEVVEPLREQYGDAIAKLGESGPRV